MASYAAAPPGVAADGGAPAEQEQRPWLRAGNVFVGAGEGETGERVRTLFVGVRCLQGFTEVPSTRPGRWRGVRAGRKRGGGVALAIHASAWFLHESEQKEGTARESTDARTPSAGRPGGRAWRGGRVPAWVDAVGVWARRVLLLGAARAVCPCDGRTEPATLALPPTHFLWTRVVW